MSDQITLYPVSQILPPDFNSRINFDETKIRMLADAIKAAGKGKPYEGLSQPIGIIELNHSQAKLRFGSRRLAAVKLLGWDKIPCIIKNGVSDVDLIIENATENTAREDLTTYEMARVCSALRARKVSLKDVGEKLGISAPYVSNLVAIFERLNPSLRDGPFREGHPVATVGFLRELVGDLQTYNGKDAEETEKLTRARWAEQQKLWDERLESLKVAAPEQEEADEEDAEDDEDGDGKTKKKKSYTVPADRVNMLLRSFKAKNAPAIYSNIVKFLVGKVETLKGWSAETKPDKTDK